MDAATRGPSEDVAGPPPGAPRHGDRLPPWRRPSIAKKVGLLLFLVACGGALTLAAFLWYQRAQTVDGQLIALSGSQASLADQFPIYGRLVVLGAPDAQARLPAHARSFEAMLTLLREGGDLGFWHLPPPPPHPRGAPPPARRGR